ncbi:aminodeoxychorismate lyase [Pseudomonas sp. HR96]|uniref:aminodeoxychorismate lyase n=1 Tax=Pseudomonas sp. HR96 TaxID=1027966 RepID=UPI002A75EF76|nr:aminodeoxychorismate lyase [Pseudomonas sp. HR96]WPO98753.1 aminodeoxychorismate lyase [Pseudomonas sp. HR96]
MDSWLDGQPAEAVGLRNRGLAYGDGLFETLAVRGGRALLLHRHLQRLQGGCQRLALEQDMALLADEVQRYAELMGEGVLKLMLLRGDSPRGYATDPASPPRRILQASALPVYPPGHAEQGVRLFPCQTRLAEQPLLAGLKHLNRLEQVLARAEWRDPAFAEGLMLDTGGRLIEGVYSNLFLVNDGVLRTADLSRCGVAGVMRGALLAQAPALGITTVVGELWPADLRRATEVFLCNSVYGVWPVQSFTDLRWSPGPVTRKLQAFARTLLDA